VYGVLLGRVLRPSLPEKGLAAPPGGVPSGAQGKRGAGGGGGRVLAARFDLQIHHAACSAKPAGRSPIALVCRQFSSLPVHPWFWAEGDWWRHLLIVAVRAYLPPSGDGQLLCAALRQRVQLLDVFDAVGMREALLALQDLSRRLSDSSKPQLSREMDELRAQRGGDISAVSARVVLQVFHAGQGNRSDGITFSRLDEFGNRHGPAATYFSTRNVFLGHYAGDVYEGHCTFRWACGMAYTGATQGCVRAGGAGRLTFVDGAKFDADFDLRRECQHLPQPGTVTFADGRKAAASLRSCGAQWHRTTEEEGIHPFLILEVEGGGWAQVSDKKGLIEPCSAEHFTFYQPGKQYVYSGLCAHRLQAFFSSF
jgi:hypothetical protein